MKLIIDIDEEDYAQLDKWSVYYFREVISKGISLSEELEKIKTEIEDRYHKEMIKRHTDNGYDYQDLLLVGIDIGKNIVGKRIAELKGENK